MTALPNHDPFKPLNHFPSHFTDPLDAAVKEHTEIADQAAKLVKRLERSPIKTVDILTTVVNIQAAEDTQAILLGNASAEQLARHEAKVAKEDALIAAMEKYVVRMIGDQLGFDSADAIEVEIVGQLFVGWLADGRQRCFGGLTHNGRRWEATGTVVAEGDGYVKLTFVVERV